MFNKLVLLLSFIFVAFISLTQEKTKLPCLDKEFSVVVHIVKDSLGDPGVKEADILDNIKGVNAYFQKICASFKVCEFRYIDNFMYDPSKISKKDYWKHVQQIYHVNNRINIYYVTSVSDEAAGLADLGAICVMDSLGIRVEKKSVFNNRTLVHEMGHYFGLKHTWYFDEANSSKSIELVDGSNCLISGDGICDTPADPFVLSDIGNLDKYISLKDPTKCKFIYSDKPGALDVKGKYYNPLVGNIMSYYPGTCDCGFTDGQLHKMAETYMSNPKMW